MNPASKKLKTVEHNWLETELNIIHFNKDGFGRKLFIIDGLNRLSIFKNDQPIIQKFPISSKNDDNMYEADIHGNYRLVNLADTQKIILHMKHYLKDSINPINRVRYLLYCSHISGYEIWKRTGINQSIISRIRHGQRKVCNLRASTVWEICVEFDEAMSMMH